METSEPIEDQGGHEAGDESYPDKYTIDNVHDKGHVDGGQHRIGAETDNDERHSNGQTATETNNALDQSTDTTTTTTTTTSTSTSNSNSNSNSTTTTSPASASEQSATNSPLQQPLMPQEDATTTPNDSETAAETLPTPTAKSPTPPSTIEATSTKDTAHQDVSRDENDGDDELEEGELKDDDDDDEDDDDDDNIVANKLNNRLSNFNNDNNDDNNNSGLKKETLYGDQRLQHDPNSPHNPSNFSANRGGQGPYHHHQNQHHRRHHSPNASQHHPDMHAQFPHSHHHYGNSSNNNNNYRFHPNNDVMVGQPMPGMLPHMDHHPMAGPAGAYPRGGPGAVGPLQKSNARCRFYSKTSNKCTWGDQCRFEHRDDSPGPGDVFDDRVPLPGMIPTSNRGPPPPPPMGGAERNYPPYSGRYQPYPPPPPPPHPYGYGPYEQPPYGPHHSTSPPLPPHSMPPHHWRQQHSPYPPSSSGHPPESVSPALLSNPSSGSIPPNSSGKQPPTGSGSVPPAPLSGGAPSPGYSSPSSSAVYERKHRLAYELAPWNDRGHPANKYDRGEPPGGYPPPSGRGSFYRNHYNRDSYGREPPLPPHMSGPTHSYPPGYPPNYPSSYRGAPMGPHASHYRYSSSSQRNVPPDTRRSRSNKRGHDEDESSWSDSGSEDSILGQASSSSKSLANKLRNKRQHHQQAVQASTENASPKDSFDQGGSGTPPGEPLPEDRERQEMLLNKLKEIEDLMAKKKGEQDDPM